MKAHHRRRVVEKQLQHGGVADKRLVYLPKRCRRRTAKAGKMGAQRLCPVRFTWGVAPRRRMAK